ncbi:DUF4136 domain-containing protein [Pontibacter sp. SGAir0037]|uniref:DUF4136 domain-containing protein n=1 Tax=Pontibacter sp. SGAir0037 TaxID=2571030 RepID=UPI0010CCE975|nr:DUF4136 domain-containing protein [Pontibacter sp. SGAir0037]QCR22881.1 DUF4136 domain-containing protein [Pontibacter sp. SGAir0037]
MKNIAIIWCCLLALVALACSPVTILNTEASENFSLGNYQTFGFYEVDASGDALGTNYGPQLEYLKQEISRQLAARGLAENATEPDLRINIGVVVAEEVQTRETNLISDPPTYIGQRRYTWRSREVEVGRYREGTLSLHLVDREREALVWQGTAEAVVPKDPEDIQARISKGVEKLMSRIP